MKRRIVALLLALSLALVPMMSAMAEEEELFFSGNDLTQDKTESGSESAIDSEKDQSASILESLGQKDWNALADAVKLTEDWRDDLVTVAESQVGYSESKDGMTIYTEAAGKKAGSDWTALFVNWVAEKAGLSSREFPRGESYKALRSALNKVGAVKKISRSSYPTAGDLAFIESGKTQLVGIVTYVSNGYASVIVADVNGRVVKETYAISKNGFKSYADLNVLMERAGIEVGKGGEVPYIPEGGLAAWTNTNAVYMRSEPTTASSRVTTVKKANTALVVFSGALQEDGYIWYEVQSGKHHGYIRGDLLALDMEALQANAPAATPAPSVKPESTAAPGCSLCANEAAGLALPVNCCYEQLMDMGAQASCEFMSALLEDDYITFMLYVNCHNAHVQSGAEAAICGDGCAQSILAPVKPGPDHTEGCAWYAPLQAQERVINIVVTEPENAEGVTSGQQVTFTFEVYGAIAYQWYQQDLLTVLDDGQPLVTQLTDQNSKDLTVTATAQNNGYIYYCVATLADGVTTITSKPVTLTVAENTHVITADAIIGEEVYFTYKHPNAASTAGYQWYVKAPGADEFARVVQAVGIEGANSEKLSLIAELEMSGAIYYAVALAANGDIVGTSQQYSYIITLYDEYAVTSCTGHDLCKYVEELANMTRTERYNIMTGAWNMEVNGQNLAELVRIHWQAGMLQRDQGFVHVQTYPTLLCTCETLTAPIGEHAANCPWQIDASTTDTERYICESCQKLTASTGLQLPEGFYCFYDYLATMTVVERFDMLNELYIDWKDGHIAAYKGANDNHVEQDGYPSLLCNCLPRYVLPWSDAQYRPGSYNHPETCPWHMTAEEIQAIKVAERVANDPAFAEWLSQENPAFDTIERALAAETLDHLVVDNGMLYIAREAAPCATVDDQGNVTSLITGLKIGKIENGKLEY